ncbi:MAG: DUF6290 family protein [Treponema sp.]|jgi:predicted DNA-binding protein|nr:DUF6290 family protein [Treponema sp.]
MSISLRVTNEEMAAIQNYAKLKGISVSVAVRNAILEQIEDELDVKIAEQAYVEWIADGKKTYTIEEVNKKLGIR